MADSNLPAVLHISTPDSWRGGEQQLAYLLGTLRSLGLSQQVICRKDSPMAAFCEREGFPFHALKKSSGVDPSFARQISRIAKQEGMDLIHTHDAHAHSLSILATVFFGNQVPLVVARRVDFPIRNSWFSRFKYNHSIIRRIVCVSDAIKAITAAGLKKPEVLVTVHSGIDPNRFPKQEKNGFLHKELGLEPNKILIGNVAALAPHKDYFTFLDTAALLLKVQPELQFLAIGDGPQKGAILAHHQELKLGDAVRFLGFRKDIPDLLPELDLFLITSETEGLGTSILDAFAAGVPVVATKAGGIPEIVIDGETGLLGEVKNPHSLGMAVEKMRGKPELRDQLVAGARKKLQDFTKTAVGEKTLQVYREILS